MYARSTTIEARPSCIDAGIAYVRDEAMPALQAMDGCVGLSLLVEREWGRCIATSAWDSAQSMRASEPTVRPIRGRAAEAFGGPVTVEEWEIAAPPVKEFEGFCSASLFIDRASGRAVTSVMFDSREAMDRTREQARSLRAARLRELGADQIEVCEFELALAHLRVPELV